MIVVAVARARLPDRPARTDRRGSATRSTGDASRSCIAFAVKGGENRFWSAILTPALRHPVATVTRLGGDLLALAVPALGSILHRRD